MYSKDVRLGAEPVLSIRGAYRPKFTPKGIPKSTEDVYAYIESHSGEYDEFERKVIYDPYADGWAWRQAGRRLDSVKVSRWMSGVMRAEHLRLFSMGFNDCAEVEG